MLKKICSPVLSWNFFSTQPPPNHNQTYISSFFFYAFCFSPTSWKILCLKICFPQYFGITRRNIYTKNKVIFIFLRKKADFCAFFLYGQRSVAEPGPNPSQASLHKGEIGIVWHKKYPILVFTLAGRPGNPSLTSPLGHSEKQ